MSPLENTPLMSPEKIKQLAEFLQFDLCPGDEQRNPHLVNAVEKCGQWLAQFKAVRKAEEALEAAKREYHAKISVAAPFEKKKAERDFYRQETELRGVIPRGTRWITFLGNSGNGKTHLAKQLFLHTKKQYTEHHLSFLPGSIIWLDFVQGLRAGTLYSKLEDMKQWPVLFLDDIGVERDTTGFAAEQLTSLLITRATRWTILTSNWTMDKFEKFDTRVASRLNRDGNIVVENNADDYGLR